MASFATSLLTTCWRNDSASGPARADLAHVGDVEHAAALAHGLVLGGDALVLDGHLPARERDQPGAGGDMLVVEGGAPQGLVFAHARQASGSSEPRSR